MFPSLLHAFTFVTHIYPRFMRVSSIQSMALNLPNRHNPIPFNRTFEVRVFRIPDVTHYVFSTFKCIMVHRRGMVVDILMKHCRNRFTSRLPCLSFSVYWTTIGEISEYEQKKTRCKGEKNEKHQWSSSLSVRRTTSPDFSIFPWNWGSSVRFKR